LIEKLKIAEIPTKIKFNKILKTKFLKNSGKENLLFDLIPNKKG
jgi:hypothetical protein